MSTLIGDALYASAFLSYIGFFDHYYRNILLNNWKKNIIEAGLRLTQNLSLIEFLSLPQERIGWQSKGLPNDELCTENVIVMHNFNRYPLLIDPSGQALDFLLQYYKKIKRTSFTDESFMKSLENSLRFGQ